MEDLSETGRTVVFVSHNMQMIAQLCERVVLLDEGRVAVDGTASDVVAFYLQEFAGTGSSREWPAADAPGNDLVRLRSVRAILENGEAADVADVRQPVGIEMSFTVLSDGPAIVPKIKLVNGQGQVAFNAIDTDPRWHASTVPGDYTTTAWIPGNLLSEGLVLVDVALVQLGTVRFFHHVGVREAISFHVQDPGEGDSARGAFLGQWKGAVRPLLTWTSERT
jgi:lipopolysaccharide transport system ATP-binding protein